MTLPAVAPEVTAGAAPGGRRWVEVTDLLEYLSRYGAVSGIQRVYAGVTPVLGGDPRTGFVAFCPRRGVLVEVPKAQVLEHVAALAGGADVRTIASGLRAAAGVTLAGVDQAPAVAAGSGDSLLVLGGAWLYPGFFKSVQRLAVHGVGVTVLVYDLIPLRIEGYPREMAIAFTRYIDYISHLADRAPSISRATRADVSDWLTGAHRRVPPGGVIGLGELGGEETRLEPRPAWPRPFVLLVGTVEDRKEHRTALRAWERLIELMPPGECPDLVCVGRLSWNALPFIERYLTTGGLGGLLHVLSEDVDDATLGRFYRDCLFTIYPSRFEGWGLPVAESLRHGKPVITTRASSLPEVGGDLAAYVDVGDWEALAAQVHRWLVDPDELAALMRRIEDEYQPNPWTGTAEQLEEEMRESLRDPIGLSGAPLVEVGEEYGLGRVASQEKALHDGLRYVEHLNSTLRLPLTAEVLTVEASVVADLVVWVDHGERESWGWRAHEGSAIELRFIRPQEGPLDLIVCTRRGPDRVRVTAHGPDAVTTLDLTQGAPVVVGLGRGPVGTLVGVRLAWTTLEPIHGRRDLGIESFIVVRSGDDPTHSQRLRLRFEAEASRSREIAAELIAAEQRAHALRVRIGELQAQAAEREHIWHAQAAELASVAAESAQRHALIGELIALRDEQQRRLAEIGEQAEAQRQVLAQIYASRMWQFSQIWRLLRPRRSAAAPGN